jgi:DNA (cytosine-5)-methyltransferase 1
MALNRHSGAPSKAAPATEASRERVTSQLEVVCVDLFCGAGGLTHGLIAAGVKVRAGVDFEDACRHPYVANHEGVVFHRADVAELEASTVEDWFAGAKVRVLAGCAPCQPFSTYALRYQKDEMIEKDRRWSLLDHFGRLVRDVRPDIVTMENVPAVTRHSVFNDFKSTLESLGYKVWVDVVDCAAYGLPQRRNRTVLLASLHGEIKLREPIASEARTVEDVIKELPPLDHGGTDESDRLHTASRLSALNLQRIEHSKPGGTWRDWPKHLVAKCHRKSTGKKYPAVYGRMRYDEPAPTLTTQFYGFGSGRFGHPEQSRGLSLREGALLQGFPRDYSFIPEDQPIQFKALGRMIGNAVPVDLGRVIGQSIIEHVKQSFGVRANHRHVGQPSPATNHRRGRNGRERTGRSVNA